MPQHRPTTKPKKLRALRARQRRRKRNAPPPTKHDMRSRYRERDLPTRTLTGVMTIEDPYTEASRIDRDGNLDASARLEQARHNDGTIAEGAPGWSPPRRPLMSVFTALRDDPVGRMAARHQIDSAQYHGARAYQEIWDAAQIGSVGAIDISKPVVDGGSIPELLTDNQRHAAKKLRRVESALFLRLGSDGVHVSRAILAERQSLDRAARLLGARSRREIDSWGWLFRRALDVIAISFGFANSTFWQHKQQHSPKQPLDPALDPTYFADARDLANHAIHCAEANTFARP